MPSNDKISKLFAARNKARSTIEGIVSGKEKYFVVNGDEPAADKTTEHHTEQGQIIELLDELAATSERRRAPR